MAITSLLENDSERCFIAEDLRVTEGMEEANAAGTATAETPQGCSSSLLF